MLGEIKRIAKFLFFRWKGVRVAYRANVDVHSRVGKGAEIGQRATLSASRLADHVTLSENVIVSGSDLGDYSKIFKNTRIESASIGRCTYIAEDAIIAHASMGAFCSVGPRVIMGYGEHPTNFVSTSPVFYSNAGQTNALLSPHTRFTENARITVGNDVWVGAMVFIRNGVTIGDGAIIAAGAVVVSNVPAYAIYGGVPARFIRSRFPEDTCKQLQASAWWNWDLAVLKDKLPLFQKEVRYPEDFPGLHSL